MNRYTQRMRSLREEKGASPHTPEIYRLSAVPQGEKGAGICLQDTTLDRAGFDPATVPQLLRRLHGRGGGEFYTPETVSSLIGSMVVNPEEVIAEGKPVSISDPCIGSGGGNTLTMELHRTWKNVHWCRVGEDDHLLLMKLKDLMVSEFGYVADSKKEPAASKPEPKLESPDEPEGFQQGQLDLGL